MKQQTREWNWGSGTRDREEKETKLIFIYLFLACSTSPTGRSTRHLHSTHTHVPTHTHTHSIFSWFRDRLGCPTCLLSCWRRYFTDTHTLTHTQGLVQDTCTWPATFPLADGSLGQALRQSVRLYFTWHHWNTSVSSFREGLVCWGVLGSHYQLLTNANSTHVLTHTHMHTNTHHRQQEPKSISSLH